jgi:RNA polymerase sigma factor (sigma-70 family)
VENQATWPDDSFPAREALTDDFLVDQFVTRRNPDAFAALMERHGPYILGVCQRLTVHAQDAEDVFQACFLELVRSARLLSRGGSVVAWLHTVAVRIARRARLRRERQQQKEAAVVKPAGIDPEDVTWREVRQILEEEVAGLSEELRAPVILCLFQEQTQEEAAQHLQLNPRTLRDRLQRGRARLRARLTRRGITLAVLGAILSAGNTRAAVTAALQQATLQGAVAVVEQGPLAAVVSPGVLGLITSTGWAGWTVAVVVAALVLCGSAGYLAWDVLGSPGQAKVVQAPRAVKHLKRSFRNKQFDADVFAWVGTNPAQYTRREDEGLRITCPEKDGPPQPVGVKLRYPVRGDFEIEATLEILSVAPPQFYASGVDLYLFLESPERHGLWLGKMKIIEEGLSFLAGGIAKQNGARVHNYSKARPTAPELGLARLRIVRQGARFSFWGAEGDADYQLVDALDISAADVSMVRFAVEPGRQRPTGVDARLVDFSITAEELVGLWSRHP